MSVISCFAGILRKRSPAILFSSNLHMIIYLSNPELNMIWESVCKNLKAEIEL